VHAALNENLSQLDWLLPVFWHGKELFVDSGTYLGTCFRSTKRLASRAPKPLMIPWNCRALN
jgi:hypothetical protein